MQLGAGHAGVQDERGDGDPAAISRTTTSALNGRPALAISALPGSVGEMFC